MPTSQWSQSMLVAAFGGIGGLVAWILAHQSGTLPKFGFQSDIASALATMLIGAVAAWFSIFVAIPTDMAQFRKVLGISLACGVFWQPVILGMQKTVQGFGVEKNVDALNQVKQSLDSADHSAAAINNAANAIVNSSVKASNVDDSDQKKKLEDNAKQVIDKIPEATKSDPASGYDALGKVAVATTNNSQPELTVASLDALQKSAPKDCSNAADPACVKYRRNLDQIKIAAENKGWLAIAKHAETIKSAAH